ncbi:hypothetical protein LXL04_021477 [Taraxacum kok-saghyz]
MSSTGATIGDLRSSLSSTTATRPPMSSTGATWMLASSKPIGYPSLPIRNFQFRYRPTYPLPLPPPPGPPRSCRHLHSNSDSIFTRSPIPLTHSKPRPVYTAAKSPADWKRNQRDAIITGIGEICGFQTEWRTSGNTAATTPPQLRRSDRGGFTLRYIMMCLHDYD